MVSSIYYFLMLGASRSHTNTPPHRPRQPLPWGKYHTHSPRATLLDKISRGHRGKCRILAILLSKRHFARRVGAIVVSSSCQTHLKETRYQDSCGL